MSDYEIYVMIFQQKCLGKTPTIHALKHELLFYYFFEKDQPVTNNKIDRFKKKWEPIVDKLISDM